MKKKALSIILAILISDCFGAESKILNKLGAFMPNFTEISYVTDILNVYYQVSGFVRATNKLVKRVKQTQQEWNDMTAQIEDMYGTLKSLRDINLYDMDTWSQTLEKGSILLRYDVADLIHTYDMLEIYSLGGVEEYMQSIHNLSDYKNAMEARKQTTKKYFLTNDYENALGRLTQTMNDYKYTSKQILETMLNNEREIYTHETNPKRKIESEKRILEIQTQIEKIDETFQSSFTKIDTIMDESSSMIAANLTEVQLITQKIKEIQDNAMSLVDSYEKLKNGNISTNKKTTILSADPVIDINKYDATDPDKVPAPATPSNITPKETKKKTVGNEDIKNMANAVDFLMLKQEALMRDIDILKCNTMAFILSLEAFKQNSVEQNKFAMAHSGKMLERRLDNK